MNLSKPSVSVLVERLLERGLGGTQIDLCHAAECSLAVLRYGFDNLSEDDRRWLEENFAQAEASA